jgi:predicted ATP-grasp superfamily ATP-dependent carboligase
MSPASNKPVVLLGLPPQGLFLLRELSRAGFEVHAVTDRRTPGYYSKYGIKYLISGRNELRATLEGLNDHLGYVRCYITSGALLDEILECMPAIFGMFEVYPRPIEAVMTLNDKTATYGAAKRCGIETLETFPADHTEEITAFLGTGRSLIAKWNVGTTGPFKTRMIHGASEYRRMLASISAEQQRRLILQRFLESDQTHNIAYLGYYVDGAHVAGYLAQQLRQYPQGITSRVCEYTGEYHQPIVSKATALFQDMRYTGFAEAEFKIDPGCGSVFLLEVNPRVCGWSSALRCKYPDLSGLFKQPFCREEPPKRQYSLPWCNLLRDTVALLHEKRLRSSIKALAQVASVCAGRTLPDILDVRDLRPFLRQFV